MRHIRGGWWRRKGWLMTSQQLLSSSYMQRPKERLHQNESWLFVRNWDWPKRIVILWHKYFLFPFGISTLVLLSSCSNTERDSRHADGNRLFLQQSLLCNSFDIWHLLTVDHCDCGPMLPHAASFCQIQSIPQHCTDGTSKCRSRCVTPSIYATLPADWRRFSRGMMLSMLCITSASCWTWCMMTLFAACTVATWLSSITGIATMMPSCCITSKRCLGSTMLASLGGLPSVLVPTPAQCPQAHNQHLYAKYSACMHACMHACCIACSLRNMRF